MEELEKMAIREFVSNLPRPQRRFARLLMEGQSLSKAALSLGWTKARKEQETINLRARLTEAGFKPDGWTLKAVTMGELRLRAWHLPSPRALGHRNLTLSQVHFRPSRSSSPD
jgi:hypothetical protein